MQSLAPLLLLALVLPVLTGLGGIEGGPHDLAFPTGGGHVGCVACHHPHTPAGKIARWQAVDDKTARFSFYRPRIGLPDKSTLTCLSCHDGAIADVIPVASARMMGHQIGRSHAGFDSRINVSLGSHPVGVRYPQHGRDFVSKTSVEGRQGIRLPEGRVGCISCHDPHGTSGHKYMLVKSNRRSALCLSCHQR